MPVSNGASIGLVGFLFGVFTAYWAQTSGRNAWLWFFFGWVLPPVAGLMLLWKNSADSDLPPKLDDTLATRKDAV